MNATDRRWVNIKRRGCKERPPHPWQMLTEYMDCLQYGRVFPITAYWSVVFSQTSFIQKLEAAAPSASPVSEPLLWCVYRTYFWRKYKSLKRITNQVYDRCWSTGQMSSCFPSSTIHSQLNWMILNCDLFNDNLRPLSPYNTLRCSPTHRIDFWFKKWQSSAHTAKQDPDPLLPQQITSLLSPEVSPGSLCWQRSAWVAGVAMMWLNSETASGCSGIIWARQA